MKRAVAEELLGKMNVRIEELKEGPVYLMLVNESDANSETCASLAECLQPADIRIMEVPDVNRIRVFELDVE